MNQQVFFVKILPSAAFNDVNIDSVLIFKKYQFRLGSGIANSSVYRKTQVNGFEAFTIQIEQSTMKILLRLTNIWWRKIRNEVNAETNKLNHKTCYRKIAANPIHVKPNRFTTEVFIRAWRNIRNKILLSTVSHLFRSMRCLQCFYGCGMMHILWSIRNVRIGSCLSCIFNALLDSIGM